MLVGFLLAAACTDATFNLLPEEAKDGGLASAGGGSGGDGGTAGHAAGRGGTMAGHAGADPGPAGAGNDSGFTCGPDGCQCQGDDQCAPPTPSCSPGLHRCVGCRPPWDCPLGKSCEQECLASEACDAQSRTCVPACGPQQPCLSAYLHFCDGMECRECDYKMPNGPWGCDHNLKCVFPGRCVECIASTDCLDNGHPVCNPSTFTCVPCQTDSDCNPGGPSPGFGPSVCDGSGHCVLPPAPPPNP
jgi:hypothetical protein